MTSGYYHHLFDIILCSNYASIFLWWHGAFLLFVGRMRRQNQNQLSEKENRSLCVDMAMCAGYLDSVAKTKNVLLDTVVPCHP